MSTAALTWGLNKSVGDSAVINGTSGGLYNALLGFIEVHTPIAGKSEWGMDTLTRLLRGIQPNEAAFAAALAQGQTYVSSGTTYYLQTWEPDNNPVHPGFTLQYKGLIGGIPAPKAEGQTIEQSITLSAGTVSGYQSATRDIRYCTRSAKTRYIATSRPTSPTYGLDVSVSPRILYSVIRATDTSGNNFVFSGANAPAALVSALTPAGGVLSFMECSPVVGSPYFECTDSASYLYQGS